MSEIKVGDLVIVVRQLRCPCDLPSTVIGKIFVVTDISKKYVACRGCLRLLGYEQVAHGLPDGMIPLYRLRKIDPPAIDESTEHKEELTA